MYFLAFECLYFFELMDELAIVDILHIGGKLEDGHFLDDRDIKQAIVGNGIGHHHHATSIEAAIANRKAQNAVIEDQIIVNSKLDMCDFVFDDALD